MADKFVLTFGQYLLSSLAANQGLRNFLNETGLRQQAPENLEQLLQSENRSHPEVVAGINDFLNNRVVTQHLQETITKKQGSVPRDITDIQRHTESHAIAQNVGANYNEEHKQQTLPSEEQQRVIDENLKIRQPDQQIEEQREEESKEVAPRQVSKRQRQSSKKRGVSGVRAKRESKKGKKETTEEIENTQNEPGVEIMTIRVKTQKKADKPPTVRLSKITKAKSKIEQPKEDILVPDDAHENLQWVLSYIRNTPTSRLEQDRTELFQNFRQRLQGLSYTEFEQIDNAIGQRMSIDQEFLIFGQIITTILGLYIIDTNELISKEQQTEVNSIESVLDNRIIEDSIVRDNRNQIREIEISSLEDSITVQIAQNSIIREHESRAQQTSEREVIIEEFIDPNHIGQITPFQRLIDFRNYFNLVEERDKLDSKDSDIDSMRNEIQRLGRAFGIEDDPIHLWNIPIMIVKVSIRGRVQEALSDDLEKLINRQDETQHFRRKYITGIQKVKKPFEIIDSSNKYLYLTSSQYTIWLQEKIKTLFPKPEQLKTSVQKKQSLPERRHQELLQGQQQILQTSSQTFEEVKETRKDVLETGQELLTRLNITEELILRSVDERIKDKSAPWTWQDSWNEIKKTKNIFKILKLLVRSIVPHAKGQPILQAVLWSITKFLEHLESLPVHKMKSLLVQAYGKIKAVFNEVLQGAKASYKKILDILKNLIPNRQPNDYFELTGTQEEMKEQPEIKRKSSKYPLLDVPNQSEYFQGEIEPTHEQLTSQVSEDIRFNTRLNRPFNLNNIQPLRSIARYSQMPNIEVPYMMDDRYNEQFRQAREYIRLHILTSLAWVKKHKKPIGIISLATLILIAEEIWRRSRKVPINTTPQPIVNVYPPTKDDKNIYSFDKSIQVPPHCKREIYRDKHNIYRSVVVCVDESGKKTTYYDA